MRKVMIMNGKYIDHSGLGYKVKQQNWISPEETTYTVIDTFKTLEEVVNSLKKEYDHIEICEGINEEEIQDLYFGFDNGLKEKIEKHSKQFISGYKLSKSELEIVLQNMTRFHYSCLQGDFKTCKLFGIFGERESLRVEAIGRSFFKPTMMGDNKIKINNSYFSYEGVCYLRVGCDSRSLELEIRKGRRTIELKFVPQVNRKY